MQTTKSLLAEQRLINSLAIDVSSIQQREGRPQQTIISFSSLFLKEKIQVSQISAISIQSEKYHQLLMKKMEEIQNYIKELDQKKNFLESFSLAKADNFHSLSYISHADCRAIEYLKEKIAKYQVDIQKYQYQKWELVKRNEQLIEREQLLNQIYARVRTNIKNGLMQEQTKCSEVQIIQNFRRQFQSIFVELQSTGCFTTEQSKFFAGKLKDQFAKIYTRFNQLCLSHKKQEQSLGLQLKKQRMKRQQIESQRNVQSKQKQGEYAQRQQIQCKYRKCLLDYKQLQQKYRADRQIMQKILEQSSNIMKKNQIWKIAQTDYIFMKDEDYEEQRQSKDFNLLNIYSKINDSLLLQIKCIFRKIKVVISTIIKNSKIGVMKLNLSDADDLFDWEGENEVSIIGDIESQQMSQIDKSDFSIDLFP